MSWKWEGSICGNKRIEKKASGQFVFVEFCRLVKRQSLGSYTRLCYKDKVIRSHLRSLKSHDSVKSFSPHESNKSLHQTLLGGPELDYLHRSVHRENKIAGEQSPRSRCLFDLGSFKACNMWASYGTKKYPNQILAGGAAAD